MRNQDITLDDKYEQQSGRVWISGIQALVRLLMLQKEADEAAGLNTGGFVSGYRGSPLGTLDNELWRQTKRLDKAGIRFQPGLNEDLAATAVWGSQQASLHPANVQGAFGMWYGKAPGVDRTMDVFKHANMAGTSRFGGVLAIAGDDHGCASSTLPSQSDQLFEAALMPIINPAGVQEYLEYGLLAWALSRYAGVWVGFKAIAETVESAVVVDLNEVRRVIITPTDFDIPAGGLNIRWPDIPLDMERRLHGPKMEAVAAFARANSFDRLISNPPAARIGLLATGKAFMDLRQALEDLGITPPVLERLGIRIYKPGLTWPLEKQGALRFAEGLTDILVVEEKRSFVERQLVEYLYNMPADRRPTIVGKRDETGARLLPSEGELSPGIVARAVFDRLKRLGATDSAMQQRLERLKGFEERTWAPTLFRSPYFCSGCPHNTSTQLPEGSRALAGIGCHGMASFMPARNTHTPTQMGGEGATWIGQAPFVKDKHVFQNLGDGTYTHSGSLAVRAAVASGVNITYKILFNDAVAMTGGQPAEGGLTVPQIAAQMVNEGVARVVVLSEDPTRHKKSDFPSSVEIYERDRLPVIQQELRDTPGVTVMIYDQTCAAEKRRRRKRGTLPDPDRRVFINPEVCEGCGDCTVKSSCIAVQPLETPLGRKRQIDQSSCNKDFSCLKGFCPSFVTIVGGKVKSSAVGGRQTAPDVPEPIAPRHEDPFDLVITGIGGTGVLTIGALLGMAAHLDGKFASVLDSTGMSQKNGAVMSYIRVANSADRLNAVRVAAGSANLLLACDLVTAASKPALSRVNPFTTRAVVNTHMTPTVQFLSNQKIDLRVEGMLTSIAEAVGEGRCDTFDATGLATHIIGDSIGTNMAMLGYAFQKGLIPISRDAIERAITLNGVAIRDNLLAFAWGRAAAHDPGNIDGAGLIPAPETKAAETVTEIMNDRVKRLTAYQNGKLARRYSKLVNEAIETEKRLKRDTGFALAVASNFYKLLAIKDEYEVARLHADPSFRQQLNARFEGPFKVHFHLAPPILSGRDDNTGQPRKIEFGPWIRHLFPVLAKMRKLRGTYFYIFGYTAERKADHVQAARYEDMVRELCSTVTEHTLPLATEIAQLADNIRGYGHVRAASTAEVDLQVSVLMERFRTFDPVRSDL